MSHDGDTAETYRAMNARTAEMKDMRKAANMAIIKASGLSYVSKQDDTILNFGKGVQFYPSTNKWTIGTLVKFGNAEAFIKWYRRSK
jgi:hypothetical protein